MYRFYINGIEDEYHFMELGRVFLPDDGFEIIPYSGTGIAGLLGSGSSLVNKSGSGDRDEIKRELYGMLSEITGARPPWGILTGVRPLKPALDICSREGLDGMERVMREKYLLSESKSSLLAEIAGYQLAQDLGVPYEKASLYIGIPFCPTRCAYCSFASNVAAEDEREAYLKNLLMEVKYAGRLSREHDTEIESVYIGGGTPTTLDARQLERLISTTCEAFGIKPASLEFTVEAGRPDTITEEKLAVLRQLGIGRISINPQSMKDETLRLIGRDHSADDIRAGYRMAGKAGFEVVNADLIAGLPGEDLADFEASLREIIALGASNITTHTLSVKKGSRLKENDPGYYRRNSEAVAAMLDLSRSILEKAGFRPYYIYRQKHQIGALENVGWCRDGAHSVYNIRIMEDRQTIIGLGAGAVGKVYYPESDRLERIANVSNYKIYSERFDDMLARKDEYYK